MKLGQFIALLIAAIYITSTPLWACDFCAVYNSVEFTHPTKGSLNVGVVNQFTHYESNIKSEENQQLPGQYLNSNVTQIFANYSLLETLSVQTNIPYINKRFRRHEGHAIESGSESGLGDMSILLKYDLLRIHKPKSSFVVDFLGGIKLPTGDSDRLRDEEGDEDHEIEPLNFTRHGQGAEDNSLVGGEDLALGSGSYDWIVGTNIFTQYSSYALLAKLQYSIRRPGDFDFEYGNDLQWEFGPGYFFELEETFSGLFRVKLSGETKSSDRRDGIKVANSSDDRLYLGPEVSLTTNSKWQFVLGIDFAINNESAARGVTPHYRSQAALLYRF